MPLSEKTKTTKTQSAFGLALDKKDAVPYTYKWSAWPETDAGFEEAKNAGEGLSAIQQVKAINRNRKTKARQEYMTAALLAANYVKPTLENDDQMRLAKAFDSYAANLIAKAKKQDPPVILTKDDVRDEARAKAAEFLGIEWDDDEDED